MDVCLLHQGLGFRHLPIKGYGVRRGHKEVCPAVDPRLLLATVFSCLCCIPFFCRSPTNQLVCIKIAAPLLRHLQPYGPINMNTECLLVIWSEFRPQSIGVHATVFCEFFCILHCEIHTVGRTTTVTYLCIFICTISRHCPQYLLPNFPQLLPHLPAFLPTSVSPKPNLIQIFMRVQKRRNCAISLGQGALVINGILGEWGVSVAGTTGHRVTLLHIKGKGKS